MWSERLFLLLVTTNFYEYHLFGKAAVQTVANNTLENDFGGKVAQTQWPLFPTTPGSALATGPPRPWRQFEESPPWYKNNRQNMVRLFTETNRSMAEYEKLENMLEKIESVLDPVRPRLGDVYVMSRGFPHQIAPSTEVQNMASELSLCSQGDIIRKISCRDRCGQSPGTSDSPGQCRCDLDCFVYGDCCQNINDVCPDVFVEAVTRFYMQLENFSLPRCVQWNRLILSDLNELEQTNPSRDRRVFEIDCHSKLKKELAVENIQQAITESQCIMKNPKLDQVTWSRKCSRPDVIVCGETLAIFSEMLFYWYPVTSLCYKLRTNDRMRFRYLGRDLEGMEVISTRGNCSYLRSPHTTQATRQDDDEASSGQWQRNRFVKVKLTVTSVEQETLFVFENEDLGHLRCLVAKNDSTWRCELYECSDTHLFKVKFKPCYLPSSVSLTSSVSEQKKSNFRIGQGSENNSDSSVSDPAEVGNVNVCLCFHAQNVLNLVGPWQVLIDTSALVNGQCNIRLGTSPEHQLGRISVDFSFGDGEIQDEYRPGNNLLAQYIRNLWLNYPRKCREETNQVLSMCFFSTKPTELKTCVLLQGSLQFKAGHSNVDKPIIRSGASEIHHKWLILQMIKTLAVFFVLNDLCLQRRN